MAYTFQGKTANDNIIIWKAEYLDWLGVEAPESVTDIAVVTGSSTAVSSSFPTINTNVITSDGYVPDTLTRGHRMMMIDTTGGAFTLWLPISPIDQEIVVIKDYGGACGSNLLTIKAIPPIDNDAYINYLSGDYQSNHYMWSSFFGQWFRVQAL